MSKIMGKVIFPVVAVIFLVALFYPLCLNNGVCDYLKLWLLMGIPFGFHRMSLWLITKGFDIGGTVGVFVFSLLVGGMIGGVILFWRLIAAMYYLARSVF